MSHVRRAASKSGGSRTVIVAVIYDTNKYLGCVQFRTQSVEMYRVCVLRSPMLLCTLYGTISYVCSISLFKILSKC